MISTGHYLILGAVLFTIGAVGVITRRNVIVIYMCIELMLNAVNLTLIAFARHYGDMAGHVFTFMVMAVAAAEAAVGLAIIISVFRGRETVDVDELNIMNG